MEGECFESNGLASESWVMWHVALKVDSCQAQIFLSTSKFIKSIVLLQKISCELGLFLGMTFTFSPLFPGLMNCYFFPDSFTYFPFFSFKCCEYVILYTISLEVACMLSCFCKMACRSKVVGPYWLNAYWICFCKHSWKPKGRSCFHGFSCVVFACIFQFSPDLPWHRA